MGDGTPHRVVVDLVPVVALPLQIVLLLRVHRQPGIIIVVERITYRAWV